MNWLKEWIRNMLIIVLSVGGAALIFSPIVVMMETMNLYLVIGCIALTVPTGLLAIGHLVNVCSGGRHGK